jgi:hypothetical protein
LASRFVLAEFGSDWGKQKQHYLFALWGGKPSTAKLRHRDGTINAHTLARYHLAAGRLIGKALPTAQEETTDQASADLVYEDVGNCLLEKTRDRKRFPLVFKVSYGFRRNLWGMKRLGIPLTCCCFGLQTILFARGVAVNRLVEPTLLLTILANLALLYGWLFVVNDRWVRVPADAYADRLLAASDTLSPPPAKTVRKK